MDEVTDSYNRNGFYIHENSVLEVSRVNAARNGLDMIRAGEYDTGSSPAGSRGISGDDPHVLGKISQPQIANTAIAELIRLPEANFDRLFSNDRLFARSVFKRKLLLLIRKPMIFLYIQVFISFTNPSTISLTPHVR